MHNTCQKGRGEDNFIGKAEEERKEGVNEAQEWMLACVKRIMLARTTHTKKGRRGSANLANNVTTHTTILMQRGK